jgi:serine/threonine protein phosphatase PrpC
VLDGHGGVEAAKFAQAHLHRIVAEQPEFKEDPKKALHNGFLETDKQFLQKAERDVRDGVVYNVFWS